jgi:LysR family hydrogen peroxide-inducible transcriptional activator
MELYQLRYFLEVASQRNFTRAAARLHLAQAALSEQIRKLEEELGTALVIRGQRESTLTAAGEALLLHARSLLAGAESARQAVADVAGVRGGRLVVACIPSVSSCLLPPTIVAFRAKHPEVELVLVEETSAGVAEWLESGRAELGFVQLPVAGRGFGVEQLLVERFDLVVPQGHRLAHRGSVGLSELAAESFVFYRGRARESALEACRAAGFEPRVACETMELDTVRALVAAGLGLALLPQLAIRSLGPALVAVHLESNPISRQLGLLHRLGPGLSPAGQVFRALLKTSAEAGFPQ